jgi:branched-chain amino acid transport system permease protein/urea transport system permease protein
MQTLIPAILNALTLISILMLVGLGMAIIFGMMGVINLAHGEFVTLGAFTLSYVQVLGGSYWLGIALAPLVGLFFGFLIEGLVIRHLYTRPFETILATWGISLIIQKILEIIFGSGIQPIFNPFEGAVSLFGVLCPAYRLFLVSFAGVVIVLCAILFRKSQFGLDLRAVIENREMAATMGINIRKTNSIAFSTGAALAALSGVLVAPLVTVGAWMGVTFLSKSFFVVIVGGTGTIAGVAAGSALIGFLETFFNYTIHSSLAQALVLILAIIIFRFRPQGLVRR